MSGVFLLWANRIFSKFAPMEFKRFEALFEKFPQVQIFSTDGEDLDRVITHFLNQQTDVSTMSEAMQRRIQRALAPFWQQRFVSLYDTEAPLVKNLLLDKKFFLQTDRYIEDMAWAETDTTKLDEALKIADLAMGILDRKLLSLSNGELRRVLLARMWMEKPRWVYFNDLFGGLDPEYRAHLAGCVADLARSRGSELKIAVRLAREDELLPEIPAFVYADKVFVEYQGELPKAAATPKFKKAELKNYEVVDLKTGSSNDAAEFYNGQVSKSADAGEVLFDLKNVNVRFGETDVIKNLSLMIRKGEHWTIMGENGAGKSTLLGLLTADHPQIYKNEMVLLGERPGHGLNVWEHKEKFGFFSPELALQYREDLTLLEVLCTGFTTQLCKVEYPTWAQKMKAREMLTYLGFEDVDQNIRTLSPIDKRLVLMARAAIRPPEVLLLDEPSQGLKGEYREKLFHLLQLLSKETTLILVSHYEEEWPPCMTHLLRMPKFSLN